MLRNYYLAADATASEPIVVFGGDATIDGHADDDVVVIGGTLRLGPKAVVGGDVVTVGGEAVIDPAATVRGKVDTAVVDVPNVDLGFGWPMWRDSGTGAWWPFAALSATVLRLSLVLIDLAAADRRRAGLGPLDGRARLVGAEFGTARRGRGDPVRAGVDRRGHRTRDFDRRHSAARGDSVRAGTRRAGLDGRIRRRCRVSGRTASRQQHRDVIIARRRSR